MKVETSRQVIKKENIIRLGRKVDSNPYIGHTGLQTVCSRSDTV